MISDELIQQLKNSTECKNKTLHLLTVDVAEDISHEFVCMQPSKAAIAMFFSNISKDGSNALKEIEFFVLNSIAYPVKQDAVKLFEDCPLIITKLSVELQKLVGSEAKVTSKKL